MTISEIFKYNRIIKNIIDNETDVAPLVKFKLLGMLKQFEPVVENFETIRNEMIHKYGKATNDGNYGIFMPNREDFENDDDYQNEVKEYEDTVEKFNNEIDVVVKSEADIEIKKFNYADIVDSGLSADYLIELYELIEE